LIVEKKRKEKKRKMNEVFLNKCSFERKEKTKTDENWIKKKKKKTKYIWR